MAHGTPDWGSRRPKTTVHGGIDLAELANRLGAPCAFDGRGDVVWFDRFENGIESWFKGSSGAGSGYSWNAAHMLDGGFSMKLLAGPAADRYAYARHHSYLPALGPLGVECAFSVDTHYDFIKFQPCFQTGVGVYGPEFRYDRADAALYYYDNAGNPQQIATPSVNPDVNVFNVIKMVIDNKNHKYVRVVFNNKEYDLVNIGYRSAAPPIAPVWTQGIYIQAEGFIEAPAYIDRVILTQNEPY